MMVGMPSPAAPRLCAHPGKRPGSKCQEPVTVICVLCEQWSCAAHAAEHFHTRPA